MHCARSYLAHGAREFQTRGATLALALDFLAPAQRYANEIYLYPCTRRTQQRSSENQ